MSTSLEHYACVRNNRLNPPSLFACTKVEVEDGKGTRTDLGSLYFRMITDVVKGEGGVRTDRLDLFYILPANEKVSAVTKWGEWPGEGTGELLLGKSNGEDCWIQFSIVDGPKVELPNGTVLSDGLSGLDGKIVLTPLVPGTHKVMCEWWKKAVPSSGPIPWTKFPDPNYKKWQEEVVSYWDFLIPVSMRLG